ncbi:MAG: patatin family protein [Muribaculaceae bacterium]|jgi:predicted patatin/cPLA2 family phospholipase|nr:patatin family protein [Muribaculaceae bacterium]
MGKCDEFDRKVILDERSGLVLEGGGMRGVFTCGVLDNFMDRGIRFPYSIGVSAGACNGLSYMSGQRGRAKYSNIDLLDKYRYIGLKKLLLTGNIMDFDLLFDKFPNEIIPYDYEAYAQCKERYEMVTTSCVTGEACYYDEKLSPERIIDIVRASSSLPFVCPIAYVDGEPMLDGGIADSIPIERARALGYDRNVVVLTRNRGYRKPDKKGVVPPFMYRKYPALREAIANRNKLYNTQLELIERLEDEGEIVVIRPEKPIVVDRMERDVQKLLDLYNEGYDCASKIKFE